MRQTTFRPLLIMALNQDNKEQDLEVLKASQLDVVAGLQGCYKGQTENSYAINVGLDGEYYGECNDIALRQHS